MRQKQIGSGGGNVGLTHAPGVKAALLQSLYPAVDGAFFLITAGVAGVDRDGQKTARGQQAGRLLQGRQGGVRPGNNGMVAAGTVAEVEDNRRQRGGDMLRHGFMAGVDQFDPFGQPGLRQFAGGFRNGLMLDVESPYFAAGADQFR